MEAETDKGEVASRLAAHAEEGRLCCLGLDPDPERVEAIVGDASLESIERFLFGVIEASAGLVAGYKPNLAFYERYGPAGFELLERVAHHIRRTDPPAVLIADAKRADIGHTNAGYAAYLFDRLGADAITTHPYLGAEALMPFLEREDRLVFVLCRTSNPGAGEFQDLVSEGEPIYLHVARKVANEWNKLRNCGLVVGATYPAELLQILSELKPLPILVPGVGAQGGQLDDIIRPALPLSSQNLVVNLGRSALYAGTDSGDFDSACRGHIADVNAEVSRIAARS